MSRGALGITEFSAAQIGKQFIPLQASFVEGGDHLAREIGTRLRGLHSRGGLQVPFQLVHEAQGFVVGTMVLRCGHHHDQNITARRIVRREIGIVPVVSGVWPEFRGPRVQVAYAPEVPLDLPSDGPYKGSHSNCRCRPRWAWEDDQAPINEVTLVSRDVIAHAAFRRRMAHTDIAQ